MDVGLQQSLFTYIYLVNEHDNLKEEIRRKYHPVLSVLPVIVPTEYSSLRSYKKWFCV